jgi:co-chaperonin GroES (HSP10)
MMHPRNTLVAVVEVDTERRTDTGLILPSATSQEYKICQVVEVGPGMATEPDELSTTRDLKIGQTVLVKLVHRRQVSQNTASLQPIGVAFKTGDGRTVSLVEQSQVVAILEEPEKVIAQA